MGKGGQVHHAIELNVLDRYPGVFTERQLNDVSNMRGIPGEMTEQRYRKREEQLHAQLRKRGLRPGTPQYQAFVRQYHGKVSPLDLRRKQLHNAKIRELWNKHYARLDQDIRARRLTPGTPRYNAFVRRSLQQGRDYIDWALGQFFSEYRKARDWTPGAPR